MQTIKWIAVLMVCLAGSLLAQTGEQAGETKGAAVLDAQREKLALRSLFKIAQQLIIPAVDASGVKVSTLDRLLSGGRPGAEPAGPGRPRPRRTPQAPRRHDRRGQQGRPRQTHVAVAGCSPPGSRSGPVPGVAPSRGTAHSPPVRKVAVAPTRVPARAAR